MERVLQSEETHSILIIYFICPSSAKFLVVLVFCPTLYFYSYHDYSVNMDRSNKTKMNLLREKTKLTSNSHKLERIFTWWDSWPHLILSQNKRSSQNKHIIETVGLPLEIQFHQWLEWSRLRIPGQSFYNFMEKAPLLRDHI